MIVAVQRSGSPEMRSASARDLEVAQERERLGQQPLGVERRQLAMDPGYQLERSRRLALADRGERLVEAFAHELAIALDVGVHVGKRAPVPGQAQPRVQPLDDVERVHEFADGIGRVAVVEEQRDPPEQVVPRDQQPTLGLEQADVRGRVTGGLVHAPGAEIRVDDHPRQQRPIGLDRGGDPRFAVLGALGRVPAQRLLRNAALAGDLETPREGGVRVLRPGGHVLVIWMHPQLTAGALHDRGRLAVVVGMRVRTDDQTHVLDLQAAHRERPFELHDRARLVHAGVEQHDPVAGSHGPSVAVRNPRPGQRQAQAKDARQHALATAQLGLGRGGALRRKRRRGGRGGVIGGARHTASL